MNIELLSKAAFEPFGDVIEAKDDNQHFTINYGYTERYHDLATIDSTKEGGKTGASIFVSTPLPMPITLKIMERHPLSSQAFIPMDDQPYLVAVAPAGEFNVGEMRIFLASSSQGVNYYPGTWHHFCLALNNKSQFLVIDRIPRDNTNKVNNCDEILLGNPIELSAQAINDAISIITSGKNQRG